MIGKYVDGFILPVPRDNLDDYRKMAELAGTVWREHGALQYIECLADDVKPGKVTSFPQSVKAEENETVVFAWIVYESREARDRINEKAMNDPRLARFMDSKAVPFDAKRMFWGGFKILIDA